MRRAWQRSAAGTTRGPGRNRGLLRCPRGDLNPHALIRALAPQASASANSATRTSDRDRWWEPPGQRRETLHAEGGWQKSARDRRVDVSGGGLRVPHVDAEEVARGVDDHPLAL